MLSVYHALPSPAQSAIASARGVQLRAWRYGPDTEERVARAIERESWSRDAWQKWQEERLAFVLHRAATQVPYYRDQWMARRRRGDRSSWELLENWPVLSKQDVRDNARALVAADCDTRTMFDEHTSGTSGTPLDLWFRRDTVREWYALAEARWRRWYGVSRDDRWAIFGGQLVVPVARRRPPFWVWNAALRQLYMSAYHLSPELIPSYLEALARYRIKYILGYTSALHALAKTVEDLPHSYRPEVIITNAEPVFRHQREDIERAFGAPVRATYGMSEAVTAAGECAAGTLHLWPEVGVLEVVTEQGQAPTGQVGDLIATSLLNADMPLVRYAVGDRGVLAPPSPCPCGRTLPALASVEGRVDDVLLTSDGRRVGRLDPVFKSQAPIREAQIIQESLRRIRVRYVPDRHFTPAATDDLASRIRERMGDIDIVFESVDAIPRGANGKFRAVVSLLTSEARDEALLSRGVASG